MIGREAATRMLTPSEGHRERADRLGGDTDW
jgi:hypothetical protein